jgi:hypothetical protein|tara:strand:+ start:4386 stop:4601 length:216 start_codon:yes stop_codon:yes gene_type:complete
MNFKKGEKVLITTYNPPLEGTVADSYQVPFEQMPITDVDLRNKYHNKSVPIVEVFIKGKLLSFISDIVKKG